jgi:hypothetical protein
MKQKEKLPAMPGPFGPIFDLSRSLNPHVFTLPASVRRQSHSERDKAKDAKDLEYADLVKNPDHTLARYTADEAVVSSRRKGVRHLTDSSELPSLMLSSSRWPMSSCTARQARIPDLVLTP